MLIGAINTIIGYLLFAGLELTLGQVIGYLGSLYISYAIAVTIAFVLHRRVTFRVTSSGSVVLDFVRFCAVYVVALAINTVLLPLLVEGLGWLPIPAQAVVVVITTLLSFLGHKYFSFRRRASEASAPDRSLPMEQ